MAGDGWRDRLRRTPLLRGVMEVLDMFHDVYEAIGWTDPAYHHIRSSEERLAEARKIAAIGSKKTPPGADLSRTQGGDEPASTDEPE